MLFLQGQPCHGNTPFPPAAQVLLPLLSTLLPERPQSTALGAPLKFLGALFSGGQPPPAPRPHPHNIALEEMQARAVGLLTKSFLHYLRPLSKASNEFPLLWQRILTSYGQYYNQTPLFTDGPGVLQEAVKEVRGACGGGAARGRRRRRRPSPTASQISDAAQ